MFNKTFRLLFKFLHQIIKQNIKHLSPIFVSNTMKMVKKGDLDQKICVHCKRPFIWRKKWEKNWADVKYCSERCKRDSKK